MALGVRVNRDNAAVVALCIHLTSLLFVGLHSGCCKKVYLDSSVRLKYLLHKRRPILDYNCSY